MKNSGLYAILLAVCAVAFSPALLFTYAITDDYVYLWSSVNESAHGVGNNFVWSLGRIVWASLYPYLFAWVGQVESLVWLRILAAAFVWATGCAFIHAFHRGGLRPFPALAGAVLISATPATGLIVSWTAAFNIAAANALATWAGFAFYYQWRRCHGRLQSGGVFCLHLGLLLLVLTLYQTAAGFFPLIVLMLAWKDLGARWQQHIPVYAAFAAFTLASLVFTFLYWTWIVPNWGDDAYIEAARFGLSLDNIAELWNQLVYHILSGWFWSLGPIAAFALFASNSLFFLVGVTRFLFRPRAEAAMCGLSLILAAAATLGASALLSYQPVQSLAAVFAWYAVVIAFGLDTILRQASGRPIIRGLTAAYAGGLAVLLPLASASILYQNLIRVHQMEYQLIREKVIEATRDGIPDQLSFLVSPKVQAQVSDGILPTRGSGLYSTSFSWVIDPVWNLVLMDLEPDWQNRWRSEKTKFILSQHGEPDGFQIHVFEELEGRDFPTVTDPHFGEVRAIREGWYYSNWFGYFQRMDEHWIHHPVLGHTAVINREEDAIVMQTGDRVWTCTPQDYPFIQIDEEWYYLDLSAHPWESTYVFHAETGERFPLE